MAQVATRGGEIKSQLSEYWMFFVFVGLLIIFSVTAPGFLSVQNFRSTTMYASDTILLAVAETFVILTGGIDLSVGAILGLTGMIASYTMQFLLGQHTGSVVAMSAGILAGLLAGTALGMINGLVVTRMNVTPFIATLGMLGVATGFTFILTNGTDVTNIPQGMNMLGNTFVGGLLPVPFVFAVVVVLAGYYILSRTRFGLHTYAIGSNPEGTRVSGVNVSRQLLRIYTLSGLISALAGILVVARLMAGSPLEGANDELNAIAAVVIGGASLFGGRGSVLGSLVGALVIAVLVTGLVIAGVQPYWQTVAIGVTIVLAVYIDQRQHNSAKK